LINPVVLLFDPVVIPHCTYTDPEVAQVGLTPRRAREQGVPIDTYRLDLAKVERAFIDGEEEGFAAIYTRRGSGEIVGATLIKENLHTSHSPAPELSP
jgi:pyruvate/2-oxoglutarate dehydrogenase complex dihydrolipoamide dehydrogenase (E3) component